MADVLGTYLLGTDTIPTIEAGVQGDNEASCVKFGISSWKEDFGDGTLSLRIQRRDDDYPYPVILSVDPEDSDTMVWTITDTDTAQVGKQKAQLTYAVDGVRKKTAIFLYRVVRSITAGDTEPDPYDDWLEELESMASDMLDDGAAIVNEAKGYRNEASGYATAASGSATSASNSASDSEAYAKGTRGGTAIDSDDPAYHKNSKYYSEQAATSASNASDSASTANTAKESASDYAEQAYLSSESASRYASNASSSATDASGFATNSAGHSQNSEAWAKGTRGGTAVGSDDPAYHNNSKYFSEQASASATAAAGSATTASDSATAAAGSATAAAASVSSLAPAYSSSATYDVGDYVLYSGSLYRCTTEITTAEEWTASHWTSAKMSEDVSDLKSDFDNKADIDGSYPELSAGNITGDYHLDTEPYLFRTTGGSADVGNREYVDKIVGGTVAWNQLFSTMSTDTKDGITTSYDSTTHLISIRNDSRTANYSSGSSRANVFSINNMLQNHVYLIAPSKMIKGVVFAQGLNCYAVKNIDYSLYIRITSEYDFVSAHPIGDVTSFYLNIIDLTALFNPTIADYIYSLEQSQAGAGVAWFRTYFPKDYYPYDPGTLRSVEGVSAHETVGFNQWDEEWELGTININTGQNVNATNKIRSKNYIPVIPSTAYFISGTASAADTDYIYSYDGDKTLISATSFWHSTTQVEESFTTPNNCRYVRFILRDTESPHDICINISDPSRNGEYEPYVKHTYPLDSSLTLRGIPKLVDGKLAFDGDVYLPSGEVDRRYKQVTLTGSENWNLENGVSDRGGNPTSRFYIEKNDLKKPSGNANTKDYTNHMTSTIPTLKGGYVDQFDMTGIEMGVTGYQGSSGDDNYLYIIVNNTINTTITTVDALKSWLSSHPLEVVYELSTPTTETADGYEQYQRCDPSGTEEFVTDSIVPVGHETAYELNLAQKLINLPWDMSMIAPVEDGATASQAYAQGKYFLRNNEFCKAKTAIASGATFTLNTNYEVTTVAAELFAALS